ncbi:MAG TPA: hypothetical protein VF254_05295, partial [Gammaproteobacteria bacterium]
MKRHTNGILHFLFILLACTATSVQPVCADELSELYLNSSNNNSNSAIGANILIVLDTSGSMTKHGVAELGFTVDPEIYWGAPYDPDIVYPGPCDANTAYRKGYPDYDYDGDGDIDQADADRDGDGDIDESDLADADFQSCDNEYNFPMTAMACQRVLEQGVAVDHFGEFRASRSSDYNGKTMNGQWYDLDSAFNGVGSVPGNWGFPMTIWRECASDYGNHGFDEVSDPEYKWPHDSGTGLGFTANSVQARDLSDRRMQLVATGNYINYFRWAQTRLAAVQAALREVIAQLPPETRVGIMRFEVNGGDGTDGGYMIQEFVELGENTIDASGNIVISPNRQAIITSIHAIDPAD